MSIDAPTVTPPLIDAQGHIVDALVSGHLNDTDRKTFHLLLDGLTRLTPQYDPIEEAVLQFRGIPTDYSDRFLYFFGRGYDLVPQLVGEENSELVGVVQQKLVANLREAGQFFREHPFSRESLGTLSAEGVDQLRREWEVIIHSFDAIAQVAVGSCALEEGNEKQIHRSFNPNMPLDLVLNFFDFSARNPKLINMYQAMLEFIWTQQMLHQAMDPKYAQIASDKATFYRLYNLGNAMNKNVPTTDATRDVARAENLIARYVWPDQSLKILFLGIGNGLRFEGPFVEALLARKREIHRITAVDLNDLSHEFPDVLKKQHVALIAKSLADPAIDLRGKHNLLVAPWSIMTDLVNKRDLIHALLALSEGSEPGALLVTDDPEQLLPDVAYGPMTREQLQTTGVWGVVEKAYQAGNTEILTLLNVMALPEWTLLKAGAGFLPVNVPFDPSEQHTLIASWQKDVRRLQEQYKHGEDAAAVEAIWMPKNQPRTTAASRRVDEKEVLEKTGLTPSVLFSVFRHFRSTRKGQAENTP